MSKIALLSFLLTFFSCNVFDAESEIDKKSPYLVPSSKVFTEVAVNNGEIANKIEITLKNEEFAAATGEWLTSTGKALVSNLSAGLTARVIVISSTKVSFEIVGAAASHDPTNNVSNVSVEFFDSAFTSYRAWEVEDYYTFDFQIHYD